MKVKLLVYLACAAVKFGCGSVFEEALPLVFTKRRSSNQSLNAKSSKSNMNIPPITSQKSSRVKLKRRQKTDETIKKLFRQLRRDSKSQLNSSRRSSPGQSRQTSIIELDDSSVLNVSSDAVRTVDVPMTEPGTATGTDTTRITGNKAGYRRSKPLNTIVIKDDEPGTSTPHKSVYSLHHSTPIKQKPSIDEMISSVNNKLLNVDNSNNNKTKEINASSFLTIDLTTDSGFNNTTQPTVIDLDATNDQHDCVLTSVSSMSGDSEVTVLRGINTKRSITSQFKSGLINLNAREKDKILAFISENLFNGCSVPSKVEPRAPETAEDTYIKEVIVGKKLSRNSFGSNVYNPEKYVNNTGLRMVVIDGSNVAMAHGDHQAFSVRGLKIVIDYFLSRGHASTDPQMLMQLERQGHVIFTPSREVQGRFICSYDDRYIIQCAAEFEGVIVSNDCFRDLISENPRWAQVINTRILQFNWLHSEESDVAVYKYIGH
ncbi:putative ribonuclease [Operophtera brumata]|uniref:Putative ribonuclease n=1 Tax=Operophtera brumata TaxID=104452 RepID=A0A0L7LJR0_OPEBR|nr:putative ribonuclease [Operophtera brumata]